MGKRRHVITGGAEHCGLREKTRAGTGQVAQGALLVKGRSPVSASRQRAHVESSA